LTEQLARFDEAGMPEIGIQEQMILDANGLPGRLAAIERNFDRLETDLSFRYSQKIDRLMILLTIIGLILAITQIVEVLQSVPSSHGK
jgi:tetrahydromethanopterin S-methyltransferase subunit G